MSKTVIVVGAGPIGCAVAFALLEQGLEVRIVDAGSDFGGIWRDTKRGPMYRGLETNLPPIVMGYQSKPFTVPPNPSGSPFAQKEEVTEYLQSYCEPLRPYVTWNSPVVNIRRNSKWEVHTETEVLESDYLVVASGHFGTPRWPPNIDSSAPEVTHSLDFYDPSTYADQKVLVVGNSSSGADVAALLSTLAPKTARKVVMACRNSAATDDVLASTGVELKKSLSSYSNGTATFEDGHIEEGIDAVICCTGYRYEFPFLEELDSKYGNTLLCPNRAGVQNLAGRIFWTRDPTLVMVGNDMQIVPFPFGECQAAAIARVWAGRLDYKAVPGTAEDYRAPMGYPKDFEYMRNLNEWTRTAGEGGAQVPKDWTPEQQKLREKSGQMKVTELRRKIELKS